MVSRGNERRLGVWNQFNLVRGGVAFVEAPGEKTSGNLMTMSALVLLMHSLSAERGRLIIRRNRSERSFAIIREN